MSTAYGVGINCDLKWTSPGDDQNYGQALRYDIRRSSVPIGSDTINWWNHALPYDSVPKPSPAGNLDSLMVRSLDISSRHFFAIRTTDENYNWSEISNIVELPIVACADITQDNSIDVLDVLYLINLIYNDGPPPANGITGDIDNSGAVNILDIIYLLGFKYKSGPPPICD